MIAVRRLWLSMTVLPFDFVRQPGEIGYRLLQARVGFLPLPRTHRLSRVLPLPRGAPCNRTDHIQVPHHLVRSPHGNRFRFFDLAPGAQKERRVLDHPSSYGS
jgi:hypothetical protein